ncbi:hypothetical protein [Roseofilum sp. Guam]|uniref:hypothetical protein n=1 Tax=Roseofilum sp. Guam TaxID=2821502 RepID=UPI001B20D70C|nr:hypothetical protein [Roseofilum sp. Guam]MBP0030004.1 hypothetical protein [Roseofilum sp. Guam]
MITPEEALDIFKQNFFELYPQKSCPSWLFSHTKLFHSCTIDLKQYRCAIVAIAKIELRENECYEEVNGDDVLVTIDPETKKKRYSLNYGFEMFPIFEAIIDLESSAITILTNKDLYSIDRTKLGKIRNLGFE